MTHLRDSRGRWVKVAAPRNWYPEPGETITGTFAGTTKREGSYGEYTCALIRVGSDMLRVSGNDLIAKIHAGGFEPGEPIDVVFTGRKDIGECRVMKMFEVSYDADFRDAAKGKKGKKKKKSGGELPPSFCESVGDSVYAGEYGSGR